MQYIQKESFLYKHFFDILSKNKTLIKNKFNQINVGFTNAAHDISDRVYYALSWNDNNEMTDDDIQLHKNNWYTALTYFHSGELEREDRDDDQFKNDCFNTKEQWFGINWYDIGDISDLM